MVQSKNNWKKSPLKVDTGYSKDEQKLLIERSLKKSYLKQLNPKEAKRKEKKINSKDFILQSKLHLPSPSIIEEEGIDEDILDDFDYHLELMVAVEDSSFKMCSTGRDNFAPSIITIYDNFDFKVEYASKVNYIFNLQAMEVIIKTNCN